ncbi:MAG TPA: acetolactate synthase large subunit [Labilithrix sp.]|nr:acetolactate synthase large subunit [Labilithrix sp.]
MSDGSSAVLKASDLFVQALEAEGVKVIFGLPGEENLDLVESLRTSTIRLVVTRHEQAAGFMAATWGRLTGHAGVALSTLGPGATNLVTAAAFAQLGGMPMLMITGQKPLRAGKQGHFQIVDVVGMMRPITKLTRSLAEPDAIPARIREAFRRAEDERPGAVHLELPEDVARESASAGARPYPPSFERRPVADERAVAHAARAIEGARRPLLMIGAGGNRKATSRMLRAFVDRTQIPFFTTQMGKGVVDERHPSWLGTAALSSGDIVHRAIEQADCIINVGHDVVEKPPFVMRRGQAGASDPTVVHIDFSPAEVDTVYAPQIEVTGDIANAVWRLAEAVAPQAHWDLGGFDAARAVLLEHLGREAGDERFPIHPPRLVAEVQRAMPDDGIVCLDNGMYKLWFARYFRARSPNTLLLDNALATMGAGLPSAIAAKLVHPDRKVLAVVGDGGLMMSVQELETAVRLGIDLTVLIVRDDAYGMIRWKQAEMGLPDHAMTFANPDFVKLAEAFGAHGHRPASAAETGQVLQRCLDAKGVHVIDVAIDYEANHRVLGEELRKLSASQGG